MAADEAVVDGALRDTVPDAGGPVGTDCPVHPGGLPAAEMDAGCATDPRMGSVEALGPPGEGVAVNGPPNVTDPPTPGTRWSPRVALSQCTRMTVHTTPVDHGEDEDAGGSHCAPPLPGVTCRSTAWMCSTRFPLSKAVSVTLTAMAWSPVLVAVRETWSADTPQAKAIGGRVPTPSS
jgi:hypothetical protein